MKGLIQANLHYLRQAAALVDAMEDTSYVRSEPMFYNSTVGGHLRHCLEHYESFAAGVEVGKIDYDARCRDAEVENNTCAAHQRISAIVNKLEKISDSPVTTHVMVKMDCGCNNDDQVKLPNNTHSEPWQPSTVGRELQFLVSHTVHHFAMIRGICQRAGNDLDPSFGMAPSTLRHREQLCSKSPSGLT